MAAGAFIAFEGIDGAGLTTQATRLRNRLEQLLAAADGSPAATPHTHLTKEPTDGPAGGPLRLALSKRLELDPATQALLFAADRTDHVNQQIQPLLAEGYVVIVDRYYLSSFAYQYDGVDGDLEWLRAINAKSLSPDLTILLDVSPDVSKERRDRDRLTAELYEDAKTLTKIRDRYREIASILAEEGEDIRIVDGEGTPDAVHDRVVSEVEPLLRDRDLV